MKRRFKGEVLENASGVNDSAGNLYHNDLHDLVLSCQAWY